MILGFSDYEQQGRRLADELGRPFERIQVHHFPDGESKVTVPVDLPERVLVCRSLDRPNDKLMELMLATETLRQYGAQQITLVAPYLCYMRQDIAFRPGEAVSQRIVGRFLSKLVDAVITVDPHLHRIDRLDQAIGGIPALALSCAPAMAELLKEKSTAPLLVGPDGESEQWVRAIAEPAGLDYALASKERLGDRHVRVSLPPRDYTGREIVLVDDMISTGRTLIEVAFELKSRGAGSIQCLVTHALHDEQATDMLHHAGIENIWSSDSITHPSNAVPLTGLLAGAVRKLE